VSAKKRILVISYDQALLNTRKMILEEQGFEVATAFSFTEAAKACRVHPAFNLVVLGHTIPLDDKAEMVNIFRQNSSSPILSVRRSDESLLPETEYAVNALAGPEALLDAVKEAIGVQEVKRVSSASASASPQAASSGKRQSRPRI
jgi:DNA-binding NtrC family response regulator